MPFIGFIISHVKLFYHEGKTKNTSTRPRWSTIRPQATFSSSFFFHPPRGSILLVAPSSSLLLSPHCSFLLIAPSSSLFLPSNCFFLHFISSRKVLTSSNLTKALWTDGPTDEQTRSLIETGGC